MRCGGGRGQLRSSHDGRAVSRAPRVHAPTTLWLLPALLPDVLVRAPGSTLSFLPCHPLWQERAAQPCLLGAPVWGSGGQSRWPPGTGYLVGRLQVTC